MSEIGFLSPLLISGKLSLFTTLILFIIGMPIAYCFSYSHFLFRSIFEAFVCMPMVYLQLLWAFIFLSCIVLEIGLVIC